MAWNPFKTIKEKLSGGASEKAAAAVATREKPDEKAAPPSAGVPGSIEELEKQGLLGKFFRHWKNPRILRQLQAVAQRMQAEGVNVKDRKAVEAWLKAHQKEIESGEFQDAPAAVKPQTFVKTGPEIGRNDPCPCGGGKKYKKCCGGKT